ncbi:hypothetical protein BEP19_14180 [Ammoniphilus oxalaticus]|uniref:DUF1294 domain-containing protein n=1 Tax=Ammoniphilus oxalaticus TaxID=66863 RepID=A0A419SEK4_9BACL|nr:DUF1294 domain-containing protein [Ammoniphilus oxalaticus]RKD21766.1 hypothetical protein BEP19_14180 [Ammoniphilus oxalaticus]
MSWLKWVSGYWFVLNIVTYFCFGLDKRRARRGRWRIPEATLFLLTACGGALGALRGMNDFRHKTRKWQFKLVVPLFITLHVLGFYWLAFRWNGPTLTAFWITLVTLLVHLIFFLIVKKK